MTVMKTPFSFYTKPLGSTGDYTGRIDLEEKGVVLWCFCGGLIQNQQKTLLTRKGLWRWTSLLPIALRSGWPWVHHVLVFGMREDCWIFWHHPSHSYFPGCWPDAKDLWGSWDPARWQRHGGMIAWKRVPFPQNCTEPWHEQEIHLSCIKSTNKLMVSMGVGLVPCVFPSPST